MSFPISEMWTCDFLVPPKKNPHRRKIHLSLSTLNLLSYERNKHNTNWCRIRAAYHKALRKKKRHTNFFQLSVCLLDALHQSVIYPDKRRWSKETTAKVDYRFRDQKGQEKKTTKGADEECQQEPIIEINSYILMSRAGTEIPYRQIQYNWGRDRERRTGKRKMGGLQDPYTARSLCLSAFQ
jgi:hypothetical protein